jgi:hypothetical protein
MIPTWTLCDYPLNSLKTTKKIGWFIGGKNEEISFSYYNNDVILLPGILCPLSP